MNKRSRVVEKISMTSEEFEGGCEWKCFEAGTQCYLSAQPKNIKEWGKKKL